MTYRKCDCAQVSQYLYSHPQAVSIFRASIPLTRQHFQQGKFHSYDQNRPSYEALNVTILDRFSGSFEELIRQSTDRVCLIALIGLRYDIQNFTPRSVFVRVAFVMKYTQRLVRPRLGCHLSFLQHCRMGIIICPGASRRYSTAVFTSSSRWSRRGSWSPAETGKARWSILY
ncbi:hypothetical protein AVEN_254808-1 [Araneus ventricosus]|uniref:Uncharacterized protein n=1 Tax=Araneus ventricosus TaxID=182803 RepID=A0A4Y2MTS0_ARAVE|nr:hypothetical protein AVEN_254808-1 [Araneus ventricosus]